MEKKPENMSPTELKRLIDKKMDELYALRKIYDAKLDNTKPLVNVDFTKYVTK